MNTKTTSKKNYKTGKDFFSRHDMLFHFLGGCLLSIPFIGFLQLIENIICLFQ